ncbi:MAG: acyl-CoA dehydrogenase family protein, partial [Spirochaetes bacterium]|nr:acyl-CoA dehydrogenase family protein [Spirochaetota bacterium]
MITKSPIVDSRDVRFVLFEMLEADKLQKFEKFADFDRDVMEDTLNLAENIAIEKAYPSNAEGDKIGAKYDPATKTVTLPDCVHEIVKAYCEAGFIGLRFSQEQGGVGMPVVITTACKEYIGAGNNTACMFPGLAEGVVDMILHCGTEEQKKIYVDKLMTGQWVGTMDLTEAEAGSDVGALKTKAVKQADGTFLITGQKIFITGCDHDLTENIIHATLARVEGDPAGTKGISIFIVPKFLINPDGSLGKKNDVVCTGLEHKMGINVSATGTLAFGENGKCVGYLLGEQRKGLNVMFLLMNEARIGVGLQSLAISSTAYMHAVKYAKNRVQGPDISKAMENDPPKVTIINHPDVKRMLLWMKSYVEGMRMLCYYLAYNMDLHNVSKGSQEEKETMGIVELLTPILKAGNSDMGWLVTAEAMQVHGGYGYCKDYPVEQL